MTNVHAKTQIFFLLFFFVFSLFPSCARCTVWPHMIDANAHRIRQARARACSLAVARIESYHCKVRARMYNAHRTTKFVVRLAAHGWPARPEVAPSIRDCTRMRNDGQGAKIMPSRCTRKHVCIHNETCGLVKTRGESLRWWPNAPVDLLARLAVEMFENKLTVREHSRTLEDLLKRATIYAQIELS